MGAGGQATPKRTSTIVKTSAARVKRNSGRNPTVATVVTVWKRASMGVSPSAQNPKVPAPMTITKRPTAIPIRLRTTLASMPGACHGQHC